MTKGKKIHLSYTLWGAVFLLLTPSFIILSINTYMLPITWGFIVFLNTALKLWMKVHLGYWEQKHRTTPCLDVNVFCPENSLHDFIFSPGSLFAKKTILPSKSSWRLAVPWNWQNFYWLRGISTRNVLLTSDRHPKYNMESVPIVWEWECDNQKMNHYYCDLKMIVHINWS